MTGRRQAATIAPPLTAATQPLTGALLCAVSLVASARPLAIELPKLPKISVPKLPDLDLPNFGKKSPAAAPPAPKPRVIPTNVKVRAASTGSSAVDAPTLADLTGEQGQDSIATGEGYKRFPARRMPGANMDGWKKIAKDITPDM